MKSMKVLFLSVLGLCISGGAHSGSVGTTLDVTVTVSAACSVSTSLPVAFSSYDQTATVGASGLVDVTCTNFAPYNIALDGGANYTASQRNMSDATTGTFDLGYTLYADPAGTVTWGDSDFAATNPWPSVADVGDGTAQSHVVYGQLPAGQDVPIDSYSDVVNVTVHY
jgi:spore coat protein U-like protein